MKLADEYRQLVVSYLATAHEYYSLLHVKWGWGDHRALSSDSELGELADEMTILRSNIEILGTDRVIAAVKDYRAALGFVEHRMEMLDQDRNDETMSDQYIAAKDGVGVSRKALVEAMRVEINDDPPLSLLIKRLTAK